MDVINSLSVDIIAMPAFIDDRVAIFTAALNSSWLLTGFLASHPDEWFVAGPGHSLLKGTIEEDLACKMHLQDT